MVIFYIFLEKNVSCNGDQLIILLVRASGSHAGTREFETRSEQDEWDPGGGVTLTGLSQ